jgi:hypothetical protein
VTQPPGHGALTNAARLAGFGKDSRPATLAKLAWKLSHDARMIAAIAEVSWAIVRRAAPEAVNALLALIRDPKHRDHARGIAMIVARTDPEIAHTASKLEPSGLGQHQRNGDDRKRHDC